MKKVDVLFVCLSTVLFSFSACTDDEKYSEIGKTTISKLENENEAYLPFEDEATLKSFDTDPQILGYNKVRKLALLELIGTGFDEEMGWTGHRLSEMPIVMYGFDNKPKYYDFVVLDAENTPVGVVTAYARKAASSLIKEVYGSLRDYRSLVAKAPVGGDKASLFVDWAGNTYAGLLGKSGSQPTQAVNTETGEAATGITELEGEGIIAEMKREILPDLLTKDFSVFDDVEETEENEDLLAEIEAARTLTIDVLADSMAVAYGQHVQNTEAFWTELESEAGNIDQIDDSEILDENGKFLGLGRLFRRVFSGVDPRLYYLDRYATSGMYQGTTTGTPWCGPWACGYILYVKTGENKYQFFEDCASTFGELGMLNFALRLFGRPMTPVEMSWSMPIASKGRIWISPFLWFQDFAAYDQIKHHNRPALRLCAKGGSLHWTVAYGAYQTGNYFRRNYYFLQQDNHSLGEDKEAAKPRYYSSVDWWNPWLMVWD